MNNHQAITPEDTYYYAKLSQLGIEEWLPIPGYEGSYDASNLGQLRSLDREINFTRARRRVNQKLFGKLLNPSSNKAGYLQVTLTRKNIPDKRDVHSIIALVFLGIRPEGLVVCHNSGIKSDNRLFNLRYDTQANNNKDIDKHGTRNAARGEDSGVAKLTEDDVLTMRERFACGETQASIARAFDISRGHRNAICHRQIWKHI